MYNNYLQYVFMSSILVYSYSLFNCINFNMYVTIYSFHKLLYYYLLNITNIVCFIEIK